jgi:predicted KAP-like P-loop ATPase
MSEMKRIKTEEDEAFELIEQAQRLREQNKEAPNVVNTKLTGWEVNYLRQLGGV